MPACGPQDPRPDPPTKPTTSTNASSESADGRISWSRFELLVEAAIKAADPGAAAEREEAERRRQFANPTQSNSDGMRGFYIRGPFAVIAKLDAAVAFFAMVLLHLGDTGSEDERRVKAVLILANPVHALHLLKAYQAWLASSTTDDPPATEEARPRLTGQRSCRL